MMIGMVLFWGVILLGIAWFLWGGARSGPASSERPVIEASPLEILERRFAEGAISAEDYRARRDVLVNGTAETNDVHNETLTTPRAGGGSQS